MWVNNRDTTVKASEATSPGTLCEDVFTIRGNFALYKHNGFFTSRVTESHFLLNNLNCLANAFVASSSNNVFKASISSVVRSPASAAFKFVEILETLESHKRT